MENQTYSFQDFVDIIKRLRADDGCPWDREQTHQSLKKCLTEECNEVLEGIEIYESTGDWDNLCEELGDVLLQVVMHRKRGFLTLMMSFREFPKKWFGVILMCSEMGEQTTLRK